MPVGADHAGAVLPTVLQHEQSLVDLHVDIALLAKHANDATAADLERATGGGCSSKTFVRHWRPIPSVSCGLHTLPAGNKDAGRWGAHGTAAWQHVAAVVGRKMHPCAGDSAAARNLTSMMRNRSLRVQYRCHGDKACLPVRQRSTGGGMADVFPSACVNRLCLQNTRYGYACTIVIQCDSSRLLDAKKTCCCTPYHPAAPLVALRSVSA